MSENLGQPLLKDLRLLSSIVLEVKIVLQWPTHARLSNLDKTQQRRLPCQLVISASVTRTPLECTINLTMGWRDVVAAVFLSSAFLTDEQDDSDDEEDSEKKEGFLSLVPTQNPGSREQDRFLREDYRSQSTSSTASNCLRPNGITAIFGPRRRSSIAMTR